MKRTIEISVRDRIAWQTNKLEYICGNGDFVVDFTFDNDFDGKKTKTARFIHGGRHTDVVFTGTQCPIPKIFDTTIMEVGVYAGDLYTTTAAKVKCKLGILCGSGLPADPTPDVYAQIMAQIESGRLQGPQGKPGPQGEPGTQGEPGAAGYTPEKGVDYWTEADIAEIKSYVDDAILGGEW